MKNCYAKCIVFLLFETGTDSDHATVLTIRLCKDTSCYQESKPEGGIRK